ncbi:MAG: protein kinase family protein [Myxococcales bacterium]|nr:protein kinase family protein [Myxococcales bacterium]
MPVAVVRVLDGDADAPEPWIVTEFMPLGSLQQHLVMTMGDALRSLRLARDVATGLRVLHGENLVHRDVKPANIFLRDLGHAVVVFENPAHEIAADFGAMRLSLQQPLGPSRFAG